MYDQRYREKAHPKYYDIYTSTNENITSLQRATAKCILLLQAYHLSKKVNYKSIEEEPYVSESQSMNPDELESYEVGSRDEKASILSRPPKKKVNESGKIADIKPAPEESPKNDAEKEFDEFEDELNSSMEKDKTIYDLINERVNKKMSIKPPSGFWPLIRYIIHAPLSIPTFFTIPNVTVEERQNFYPLALFMSILWIYVYSFIIVWWTYELSNAWGINFSIIPLLIYPIGISIRDRKKLSDFKEVKHLFAEELPDQEISLAETFSGPIFQITGLVGFTWLVKIIAGGSSISFENSNIQYQAPLLIICIIVKYLSLLVTKFKTNWKLFIFNSSVYGLFTVTALLIDYYNKF